MMMSCEKDVLMSLGNKEIMDTVAEKSDTLRKVLIR